MKSNGFVFTTLNTAWDDFISSLKSFNWTKFSIYAAIILLVIAFIILLISFVKRSKDTATFKKDLSNENGTVRVFRIDAPSDSVRYFNLGDIKTVKNSSVGAFYASFPVKEQGRVKDWIMSLLEGRPAPAYLQTDVYFRKSKRIVPSFLKLDKVDTAHGILHLENYLLRYDTKVLRPTNRPFSTESDFSQAVKANGALSGMTFCFALYRVSAGPDYDPRLKNVPIPKDVCLRFREALSSYVTGNQRFIELSPSELVIANFDMVEMSQGIFFALRVKEAADRVLMSSRRRTNRPQYEIKIGIVANKDLVGDSDMILHEARRAAGDLSIDSDSSLSFYKKGNSDFDAADQLHYRSEVDRIIYEKKLSFSYRAVFNCDKLKTYGYLARALPLNTSFSSIDELKNYALRAKDEKNLFAAIAKNLLPRFEAERPEKNLKLFYPVRMDERDLLIPFFAHYGPASSCNLIFLFKESDIATSLDKAGIASFLALVAELKKNGFGIAISLGDKALALDSSIYAACDAFFVNFSSSGGGMDTKIRSELHALVEKLLKYKQPIIGSNLMNWTALELVVGSGITYISSDVFSNYETMFKPINEKNLARIKAMKDRK